MQKIRFNESEINYNVNLSLQNDRIICVFDNEKDAESAPIENGFVEINEHNGITQSDYSNYKYIYKKGADNKTYILTVNADDIYVEPEIVDDNAQDVQLVPTLEEIKASKIQSLSSICNHLITDGVDIEINGEIKHFSYKDEDQVNIKEIFDLAIQTNVPMYYHADGESCKLYTVEQIATIYISNATNKMHHITYFNQLKLYVETLTSADDVNNITYGDELTGEYLNIYNDAMAQAKLSIETLLKV